MNILLANLNILYVKIHSFHYNVVGKDFYSAHTFLEVEYEKMHEALDTIAERIKIDGNKPLTNMASFLQVATIKETDRDEISSNEVFNILLSDYQTLVADITELKETQSDITVATLEDLQAELEKTIWFLKATLS